MCGICGEIRFDGTPVNPQRLRTINDRMAARGPDDEGIHVQGFRGFGHRRLRIMDLAQASQQPMVDPGLGLGLVFAAVGVWISRAAMRHRREREAAPRLEL